MHTPPQRGHLSAFAARFSRPKPQHSQRLRPIFWRRRSRKSCSWRPRWLRCTRKSWTPVGYVDRRSHARHIAGRAAYTATGAFVGTPVYLIGTYGQLGPTRCDQGQLCLLLANMSQVDQSDLKVAKSGQKLSSNGSSL